MPSPWALALAGIRKAAFTLAAGVAAAAVGLGLAHSPSVAAPASFASPASPAVTATAVTSSVPATGGVIHTTFLHPFYDETQASFVEAQYLHTGDLLQTPTGTAVITDLHLYHANTTTYDLTIAGLHTFYVVAGNTPVLVHNINQMCGTGPETPVNINVSWEEGMPTGQFNLKAAELQSLSDNGALFKAPNPVARNTSITNAYKANLIARAYNQFNDVNPEFFASLRTRIINMNPDHVWELQLGGPDDPSNLHILDAFTNQAIGRQIWGQIRNLPDYTPITVSIQGPP